MARVVINYKVKEEGRDKGKTFVITEMQADKAERWAMKALLAVIKTNPEIPEDFELSGMAGIAQVGLKALAGVEWEQAEPLLNEMMECVEFMPDSSKPQIVRKLFDGDIEEIMTRINLRKEILQMHVGFSKAVKVSK